MFSNLTIGLLLGVGCAAWVYSKMMHSTGGNTQNSLVVAALAGLAALAVITTFLGSVF